MPVATRSAGERLVNGLEAVGQLGKRAAAEATGMSEGTVSKKAKVKILDQRCCRNRLRRIFSATPRRCSHHNRTRCSRASDLWLHERKIIYTTACERFFLLIARMGSNAHPGLLHRWALGNASPVAQVAGGSGLATSVVALGAGTGLGTALAAGTGAAAAVGAGAPKAVKKAGRGKAKKQDAVIEQAEVRLGIPATQRLPLEAACARCSPRMLACSTADIQQLGRGS